MGVSRSFSTRSLLACALLLAAGSAAAAPPGYNIGGSLDLGYDSNVGNAPQGNPEDSSAVLDAGAHVSRSFTLNDYMSLLARANLNVQGYEAVSDLSNGKAVGLLRLFLRPDRGLFAPTFAFWGSAAYWEFGSEIRKSDEYRGGLIWLQPLTTQILARVSATTSYRSSESRVFDLHNTLGALDVEWQPSASSRWSFGYQRHAGDTVSTAAPNFEIARSADAVEQDDAFGGAAANRFAYRIEAHTDVLSLGYNYRLSPTLSLDTQVLYADSKADRWDAQYERWIVNTGLLWKLGR